MYCAKHVPESKPDALKTHATNNVSFTIAITILVEMVCESLIKKPFNLTRMPSTPEWVNSNHVDVALS